MAIVRCEVHPVRRGSQKHQYVNRAEPLGYKDTAAICGRVGCKRPGLVWLRKDEAERFEKGERYFEAHTQTVKIKVSDKALLPLP